MTMHGTRSPRPRKSSCGGGTLSYQPPQSSQSTTIAVDCQYGLSPTALTTLLTHDGPSSLPSPVWSESEASGTTHATSGRRPDAASLRIALGGEMTFRFQSGPRRIAEIESNSDQTFPPTFPPLTAGA